MRRQERKRGAMGIPLQAGLTVKALSPDKTVMGKADGINGPAGYIVLCAIEASTKGRPVNHFGDILYCFCQEKK
jgi:hypothetical protein